MKQNFEKSLNAEKREDRLRFFNIHSVAKFKKNEGGTLWWKNSFEKSCKMPKKT